MSSKKIIYIVAQNRSGSTVLSYLLGKHPDMFQVGELLNLFKYRRSEAKKLKSRRLQYCHCGKKLTECGFWQTVIDSANLDNGAKIRPDRRGKFPTIFRLLFPQYNRDISPIKTIMSKLYFEFISNRNIEERVDNLLKLYDSIFEITGTNYIIDNSKNASLAYFLKKRAKDRIRLLYNFRRGEAVFYSYLKRVNDRRMAVELYQRSMIEIEQLFNASIDNDHCTAYYEKICDETRKNLNKVLYCLDQSISSFDKKIDFLTKNKNTHAIGGSPSIHLGSGKTEIRKSQSWKQNLTEEDIDYFYNNINLLRNSDTTKLHLKK